MPSPILTLKGSPNAIFSLQMTTGTVSNRLPGALRDPFIRPVRAHPTNKNSRSMLEYAFPVIPTPVPAACDVGCVPFASADATDATGVAAAAHQIFDDTQALSCMPASARPKTHMHNTVPAQPTNALATATCFSKTFRLKLSGRDEATTLHRMTTCSAFVTSCCLPCIGAAASVSTTSRSTQGTFQQSHACN
ncbi:hypothetical protein AOQ84DRAFT_221044 [Glonium stellatum]|uniref:Uncharacterized protein n=1 Tax=Glonium stellatum TaxID=574774 RepID=A0A8E2F2B3_9PEZI|nr:hypothetical protein AOQ84DRAFT_221044 [Glonium stellatum]